MTNIGWFNIRWLDAEADAFLWRATSIMRSLSVDVGVAVSLAPMCFYLRQCYGYYYLGISLMIFSRVCKLNRINPRDKQEYPALSGILRMNNVCSANFRCWSVFADGNLPRLADC